MRQSSEVAAPNHANLSRDVNLQPRMEAEIARGPRNMESTKKARPKGKKP
jgi:hypothetical protein